VRQRPNACDGQGACKKDNGQGCAAGTECVSGLCVDGFCCDTGCTGTCQSCDVAGSEGTCTNVPSGGTDTTCSGEYACDGTGGCKSIGGTNCTTGTECGTGFCVDSKCCDSDCLTPCYACNVFGHAGECWPLATGSQDGYPAGICTGGNQCDGSGNCKKVTGQPCGAGTECLSGFCADGYCCNTACTSNCKACNLTGQAGQCGNVPAGTEDGTCTGASACDGLGGCKKTNGQGCGGDAECVSGHCVDGVCCNSTCVGPCLGCNLVGAEGTCSYGLLGSNPGGECGRGVRHGDVRRDLQRGRRVPVPERDDAVRCGELRRGDADDGERVRRRRGVPRR